jgi:serine/threonine protein kinase
MERLGDYQLLELIGDGAQGKVFKARPLTDAARAAAGAPHAAVKVFRLGGGSHKAAERFVRQARNLWSLDHPNIVRFTDVFTWHEGEWDEATCIVMEYLEGETLQDRLTREPGGLPWETVRSIFRGCLKALVYAAGEQVIHRDLKLSNIFLTADGKVKLIDFDVARHADGSQTTTAGWKGTFDYMAPDFVTVAEFRGDELSDMFSLGVCCYQSLIGALPYAPLGEGAHIGYLNRWSRPDEVRPRLDAPPFKILSGLRLFFSRCLTPVRRDRFESFAEMLNALDAIEPRVIGPEDGDRYALTGWLGRGGCGEIYEARRERDGLPVAIKYLYLDKQRGRFIREARILQKYPHPAIVQYVDFLEVLTVSGDRNYYLALELLPGMPAATLRNRLTASGALPVEETLVLFCRYLSALDYLHTHENPIIHRDLKPENLYAPEGRPLEARIFDLGIARDVTGTMTCGWIPGTLNYMPPEFARGDGDRGSPQSDLYALGLCLYEALTGVPMLPTLPSDLSRAWTELQQRAASEPEIDFQFDVFERHPALRDLIERCARRDPSDRWPSARDMGVALHAVLDAAAPEWSERLPACVGPLSRPAGGAESGVSSARAEEPAARAGSAPSARRRRLGNLVFATLLSALVAGLVVYRVLTGDPETASAARAGEEAAPAGPGAEAASIPLPDVSGLPALEALVSLADALRSPDGAPPPIERLEEARARASTLLEDASPERDEPVDGLEREELERRKRRVERARAALLVLGMTSDELVEAQSRIERALGRQQWLARWRPVEEDLLGPLESERDLARARRAFDRMEQLSLEEGPGLGADWIEETIRPARERLSSSLAERVRSIGRTGRSEIQSVGRPGNAETALRTLRDGFPAAAALTGGAVEEVEREWAALVGESDAFARAWEAVARAWVEKEPDPSTAGRAEEALGALTDAEAGAPASVGEARKEAILAPAKGALEQYARRFMERASADAERRIREERGDGLRELEAFASRWPGLTDLQRSLYDVEIRRLRELKQRLDSARRRKEQFRRNVDVLAESIPDSLRDDTDLERIEGVIGRIRDLERSHAAELSAVELEQMLGPLRERLIDLARRRIVELREKALLESQGGQRGGFSKARLVALDVGAPSLVGLVRALYHSSLEAVSLAEAEQKRHAEFGTPLDVDRW